jgi:hypothetical protein
MSDYDKAKIQEAVLALLTVFSFNEGRSWKGYDWNIMDALHERGFITDPKKTAKSIYLTEEGIAAGTVAARQLFGQAGTQRSV